MAGTEKRKQSLYFREDVLNEISSEAIRLDRSLSWVVQRAWRIAAEEVAKFPSAEHALAAGPAPTELQASSAQHTSLSEQLPGSQVREFLKGKFENA